MQVSSWSFSALRWRLRKTKFCFFHPLFTSFDLVEMGGKGGELNFSNSDLKAWLILQEKVGHGE